MAYFMTFFWTALLVNMTAYVVGSMNSTPYEFTTAMIISVIVTVLIFALGAVIPKPQPSEHH
ncbi:YjzD family protein [Jeotgalibacillus aurantiacus]|uniref:YjzD family protein n=1 Tax=Jeotgalibacillus aurantiacus TaxID=2763266 RepID=UPI001D0A821C